MLSILAVVAFLATVFVLPIVVVRSLIQSYRNKDRSGTYSGGLGGMMMEMDRVVRPSVQHVIEVKESVPCKRDDTGGD